MLQIGQLQLRNRILAAPMAGVTDKAFRILAREFGCGLVCTEMISDKALTQGNLRTQSILDLEGDPPPVAVQLFGKDPEVMAAAAQKAEAAGASLIDLNMGCPTLKIVKNGEGAAVMKKPELAARIVDAVVRAVDVPVTVKMRKGWDENSVNVVQIAHLAEENGASAVTVHGRTREQLYSGKADWGIIRQVKESVRIPVIGNGDIWEPQDAGDMINRTGCDGIMIGRGAMGNPWLFHRVLVYLETGVVSPGPNPGERITMALRHLDLMADLKGSKVAVREMRKHLAWYLKGLPGAARVRVMINQADSVKAHKDILSEYAADLAEENLN